MARRELRRHEVAAPLGSVPPNVRAHLGVTAAGWHASDGAEGQAALLLTLTFLARVLNRSPLLCTTVIVV